ncbi:MAG TPA: aldo/keto reductase [Nitrospirales bacterium]|nr:aldo/keto reductase [Nitrospirales bacterium]
MRQVTLGLTKATVSAISLGTWSYGGSNTIGDRSVGWSGHDDETAKQALIRAWELGINHWDTADAYGNGRSEELIGEMWDAAVARKDIFLATKLGWVMGPHDHYYHPDFMRHQIELSLKLLKTDVIDLLYLHHCMFGDADEFFDPAIEVLRRAKEEGKIRFIGLSDWDPKAILKYADKTNPDVIQPYRNVMDDDYVTSGLRAWVHQHNVGVAFFSPLKHGLLTGKYTEPTTFPVGDMRSGVPEFSDPIVLAKIREANKTLTATFSTHPQPVLHGLLDVLLTDTPTGCVLLGQRSPAQVEAAALAGTEMAKRDAEWVRSLYRAC